MKCWQFMKCEREHGGAKTKDLGICPAWPDNGSNCARVAGTYCGDKLQGSFAIKLQDCLKCDFYASPHYSHGFMGR